MNEHINPLTAFRVIESEFADRKPTDGENARRRVRHLYAEAGVMDWLGEDPGPLPGEVIRSVFMLPGRTVFMSPESAVRLHNLDGSR